MDGADLKMGQPLGRERAKIPSGLVQATIDSIKAGVRVDEIVVEAKAAKEEALKKTKTKYKISDKNRRLMNKVVKKESEDDEFVERAYRAHEDRRFGFLVIGDQHRFGVKQDNEAEVSHAPPLDFSFCLLNTVEEIVTENEVPQTKRNFKQCRKTHDDRYVTASLRLSYNILKEFEGLANILYKILDAGPAGLCWLDMSFNSISTFDEDTFFQLPNLKIFYLHGNLVADMCEIRKLMHLPSLRHLTLHGNPIEHEEVYRTSVLYCLPELTRLDFIGVTKGDRATAQQFGRSYERFWAQKHKQIEAEARRVKLAQAKSVTDRAFADSDTDSDYD